MRSAPSRDVAIYAPHASAFYDPQARGGGGAEFQTSQLAKGLAQGGLRVAHIVYPISQVANPIAGLDIVQRPRYRGQGGPLAKLREAVAIWRALREADAAVYILRAQGMHVLLGPLFGRLRRRRIIMSGSNDLDFEPRAFGRGRVGSILYRRAMGAVDAVVAQTEQQRRIAAREFPAIEDLAVIPSFAQPVDPLPAPGDARAFLWAARVIDFKRPLEYVQLAEAVPEARFRMVCVSTRETPAALDQELREKASRLENLELLEGRPRAQLMELFREAVAMVVTSRAEGMPNVFLEAWMRAIPVLSLGFDPDGLIERDGMGFAAGDDWDRFTSAAQRLWRDAELRERLGEAGHRYAISTHDPSVVAPKWVQTVKRLLA
jgi:glycosyltransferase involved in cell wall biosynthesis